MMNDPRSIGILLSKNAIQELYQRYARAADRLDRAALERLYHPDAHEHHGFYAGPASGFIDQLMAMASMHATTHHHIAPALIDVDGDSATGEAYFIVYQLNTSVVPAEEEVFGGRYVDRFERRDGEWRILNRRLVLDYSRTGHPHPWLTDDRRNQFDVLEGQRNDRDEVYRK